MTLINPDLLSDYMKKFYGCGNLNAPLWFVGMEAGGLLEAPIFNRKLTWWDKLGQPNTTDVLPPELVTGKPWFRCERPKLQPTWSKLIRTLLVSRGETPTRETARRYQSKEWGLPDGDAAFLEFMPLAAKNIRSWPYPEMSNLDELASRKVYKDKVMPYRIDGLRNLIAEFKPKVVLFYSTGYLKHWKEIAGSGVNWIEADDWQIAETPTTNFYCVAHPTAHGSTNLRFEKLGQHLYTVIGPNA